MTIEKFKKQNPPKNRTSILRKFKDEILQLKKDNYSGTQILDFLKNNEVETTKRNLYYFISRELKKEVEYENT
jgi:phosphopentomutase